ncbi:MAG: solute carrier 26 family protein [Cyclobacteriaceae bacterium]|nr:solute carrier 26 family protein [Cyclobacteriaceae bacterium]
MQIKQFLPIFDWLPNYQKQDLKGDFWAGLTVGVMLIPQGMAYAMVAGLPPIYGLYGAFLPQVFYSFFGTSRQLSVAPAAMISLLIGSGLSEFAAQGSEKFVEMAILLAMIVGLIQLALGLLRMGFLVNFLSQPVISGYTSSAAIIIGLSQLRHLLGVEMPSSNLIHEIARHTTQHIGETHLLTFSIGLGGIAMMLAIKKYKKSIPGAIVVVILGVLVVTAFDLDKSGVLIVGHIPEGLPRVGLPAISFDDILKLLPLAMLISLVGFMESISIAKAIQMRKRNYKVIANKELIGVGFANFFGSVFSAIPVSGGFARTAVNEQAGANTNLASIISAVVVGLTLMFFTPWFYDLPKAVLAAVIMVAVIKLIDIQTAVWLFRTNKKDFAMLLATFIFTLVFGVQIGITSGVVLSLILLIHRSAYPHLAELGKLPDSSYYRNLSRFPEAVEREDALVFRFDAELYFANSQYFQERLEQMMTKKGDALKVIVLNAQSIYAMDSSAASVLEDIVEECHQRGIEFYMTEVIGPVRDVLHKTGLFDKIGEDHFRMRVQDALDHFDRHDKRTNCYAIQTNL